MVQVFNFICVFVSGSYIFIEASAPRKAGDIATMRAGPFQGGKNVCFIFHYHMFGRHIGRLNIYQVSLNNTSEQLLWTKNGSIGPTWNKAKLYVESTNDYNVIILNDITLHCIDSV